MALRSTPAIVSALADHPDYEERLQAFVLVLGERIDACQDAEAAADLGGLRRLTQLLASEAKLLGYAPLERAALRVGAACEEGAPDTVRKATEELTVTANRVRKGHRGSV